MIKNIVKIMSRAIARMSLVFALALLAMTASAIAGDTAQASGHSYLSAAESSAGSSAVPLTEGLLPSMTKVILVLLGVIIAIYFTLSVLKKAMGRRATGGGRGDAIEVIETCYLAPKQSISLVRVGERGALLGITEKGISSLIELSAEEMLATQKESLVKDNSLSFKDAFGKARKKIVDLRSYSAKFKGKDRSAVGV